MDPNDRVIKGPTVVVLVVKFTGAGGDKNDVLVIRSVKNTLITVTVYDSMRFYVFFSHAHAH